MILTQLRASLLLVILTGCVGNGWLTDGDSLSLGPSRVGALHRPAELPVRGTGYVIPPRWEQRGLRYGTDEAVDVIVHVGRALAGSLPDRVLSVGDLSLAAGGPSRWHRSHQTGRDIDLLYPMTDARGRSLVSDTMYHYGSDGRATEVGPDGQPAAHLDVEGTWAIIKALIRNPVAEVQYIFAADDIKQLVLDYAINLGESEQLIQYAGWLMHQPSDGLPHDDHMHVRIFCSASDLDYGCRDYGILRWHKKDIKYARRPQRSRRIMPRTWLRSLRRALPAIIASTVVGRGWVPR